MYLKSLKISNMRCFRQTSADFNYPGKQHATHVEYPNLNILLGNNGMGKSATLKAVALAILSPIIESAGYVPYSIIRRDIAGYAERAEIEGELILHEQDVDHNSYSSGKIVQIATAVERKRTIERIQRQKDENPLWESMYDDESAAFLLLGYGSTRTAEASETYDRSARSKSRLLRYERTAGLFEEHATLIPMSSWLPELKDRNPDHFRQVVDIIDNLLPEGTDFEGELHDGDYRFVHRGLSVGFGAMSDGYRAYISWICDLLYHLRIGAAPSSRLVEHSGIVLVDEIDLHLHPEWQLSVMPNLSKVLPNLQFICSTHSPILAGTVQSENIFLLLSEAENDENSASILSKPEIEVHGLNAAQILRSPHFGLASSRSPAFVERLHEASSEAESGDTEAAIRFTKMMSYGAAADDIPDSEPPEWVIKASAKRSSS